MMGVSSASVESDFQECSLLEATDSKRVPKQAQRLRLQLLMTIGGLALSI